MPLSWACVLCDITVITEQIEQPICIRFCVKLEHSSTETIWMIQKAAAMGNWWLAASSTTCPFIASHLVQSFFAKHQITQMTQPPYSLDLVPCDFWLFPKTKITFQGGEISDHRWDLGKYNGASDGDWENCVRSWGTCFDGDWGVIVLCTMFLVSSSINVFVFHITWLDTFWTHFIL